MKVNEANLQTYRVDQARPVSANRSVKPVEFTQLTKARFAELLTDKEKAFIVQNFKSETTSEKKPSNLGRFLDVRA